MVDATSFVVRPLPAAGLDGAFRVHLSQESLDRLGLRLGDICQINGEGVSGFGFAWRATEKMGNSPKVRPVKMTDTLREAFRFKEGSHVTVERSPALPVYASKVVLSDMTSDDQTIDVDADDRLWVQRAQILLSEVEAFATGTTFDVQSRRRLRKRLHVEQVYVRGRAVNQPSLFKCNGDTEFILLDSSPDARSSLYNGEVATPRAPLLDVDGLAGLVHQVKLLNEHLDYVLRKSARPSMRSRYPVRNYHTLIHGYEGTGKTRLLETVASTCERVFELGTEATSAKTQARIDELFADATAAAPSIVLIDDLEQLASKEQGATAKHLAKAISRLQGLNVIVIAAARSPALLNPIVMTATAIRAQIELPVPDQKAREDILAAKLTAYASEDGIAATMASKTHGFTMRDLDLLVEAALDDMFHLAVVAQVQGQDQQEDWVDIHARLSLLNGVPSSPTTGASIRSQATTEVGTGASRPSTMETMEPLPPLVLCTANFEHALTRIGPTALREVVLEKPNVRWSDIGGSSTMKQHFDTHIALPLHNPETYAFWGMQPAKGVLMYGPPGCAKTMTAQAVARVYDLNFILVKGAELISMYVGESERQVREVFRRAQQAAPCVIFFDEIDSIGSEREGSGSKGLNVVTTLLNEMDGFEPMKKVFVLAATNKPEVLDPALLRPGRFDSHVYVGPPNIEARTEIITKALRGIALQPSNLVEQLASDTDGYSGAEIVAICANAKVRALQRHLARDDHQNRVMEAGDFEDALGSIAKGITPEMLQAYEAFAARNKDR